MPQIIQSGRINMKASWKDLEGITLAEKFQLQHLLFERGAGACFATRVAGEPCRAGWLWVRLADSSADAGESQPWQIAAGLSHPNLVTVWETGRTERGVTAMEYLLTEPADEDLEAVLRQRPLNQVEAREAVLSAAAALSYLHERALVHGRVEPAAILAVGDRIKLSSDAIVPSGEGGGGLPAAGDLRGLGDCIHTMFTQKPDTDVEHLRAIPQPFRDIIRGCHGVNPNDPWTADRIVSTLDLPRVPATPAPARPVPQPVSPPAPAAGRKRIPAWALAGLGVGAAFLLLMLTMKPRPASPPVPAPAEHATADRMSEPAPAPALSRAPDPPAKPTPLQAPVPTPSRSIWRVISYTYSKADDTARMVSEINRKWPHLKAEQFTPNGSGPPFCVALGGRMTRSEALRLQQEAISAGLPPDTFARNFSK
jgi:hypothetical protein